MAISHQWEDIIKRMNIYEFCTNSPNISFTQGCFSVSFTEAPPAKRSRVSPPSFLCDFCDLTFEDERILEHHQVSVHFKDQRARLDFPVCETNNPHKSKSNAKAQVNPRSPPEKVLHLENLLCPLKYRCAKLWSVN